MKPTKGLWIILAIIVIISMIVEWHPWQQHDIEVSSQSSSITKSNPEEVNAPPKIPETLVEEHQPIRAQLSAVNYTTITAELSEKILKLPFRDGQKFKKGDALVMFDCGVQEAQLNKSKAELSIAERNANTKEKLLKLGAVGRIEYENSLSEFQKVKAQMSEL